VDPDVLDGDVTCIFRVSPLKSHVGILKGIVFHNIISIGADWAPFLLIPYSVSESPIGQHPAFINVSNIHPAYFRRQDLPPKLQY
jgi:hypothetical protein